jgi:hypothetical protein
MSIPSACPRVLDFFGTPLGILFGVARHRPSFRTISTVLEAKPDEFMHGYRGAAVGEQVTRGIVACACR